MLTLFKSLVLPHLDYCSPLWSPVDAYSIKAIESVQRKFTRRLYNGSQRPDYWVRLSELRLYSLERRRERYIIIYLVKIVNGRVPNPGLLHVINPRTGYHLVQPKVDASHPGWLSKVNKIRLLQKGPKLFNCLPIHLRSQESVQSSTDSFKRRLDDFFQIVPDQPTVPGLQRAAASNSIADQIYYSH